MAGSERNCVFRLRLPGVYQKGAGRRWGARDCGNGGVRERQNVYQKSTKGTSAARMSGFFAVLGAFLNLFNPVTGVVQPCHPVSGNVFLLLPKNGLFKAKHGDCAAKRRRAGNCPEHRLGAPTKSECGPIFRGLTLLTGRWAAGRADGPTKAGAAGRSRH